MAALVDGCYTMVPIPDPKLGPRHVDVATMYNTDRYRPNYATQARAADFPRRGLSELWIAILWPRLPRVDPANAAQRREEIRAYFNRAAADEEHYPSTIDPRIFHVKLVLEHLGD